ncbi:hypothetical protein E5288_WYG022738 [Bos mutus]|uniref:Uncharacterized protein n=1 Tax=Bos mutus TaxID=72004 RepID=A0A6B0R1A9_9CETA|nr:hypothetical protein [Bos mutus]
MDHPSQSLAASREPPVLGPEKGSVPVCPECPPPCAAVPAPPAGIGPAWGPACSASLVPEPETPGTTSWRAPALQPPVTTPGDSPSHLQGLRFSAVSSCHPLTLRVSPRPTATALALARGPDLVQGMLRPAQRSEPPEAGPPALGVAASGAALSFREEEPSPCPVGLAEALPALQWFAGGEDLSGGVDGYQDSLGLEEKDTSAKP